MNDSLIDVASSIAHRLNPLECRRHRLPLPREETHPSRRRCRSRLDSLVGHGHRTHHLRALGCFLDLATRDTG